MKHRPDALTAIVLLTMILFILIPRTAKAESFSISGIITAESYGAPQEAWIDVYDTNLNYVKRGQYDSITGGYYVSLEQNNYHLLYFSNFPFRIPGFYANSGEYTTWIFNPGDNNLVNVNQNKILHLTLKLGYFITGTVRNSNGDPICGAAIEFYADGGSGYQKSMFEFTTDANGYFRAWALPSNQQFKIRVRSNSDLYDSIWYGNASSVESATVLTVGSGQNLAITLPDKQVPDEGNNPPQDEGTSNGTTTESTEITPPQDDSLLNITVHSSSANIGGTSSQNGLSSSDLVIQVAREDKYLITACPASSVSKVFFYLDGKLKKIDKNAPFSCRFKIRKGAHIIKAVFYSSDMAVIKILENTITK
ncbi:MAG: carboxypeptidase-like regulatory domain-containing protein [Actinobacteria bacterium]|nr:carboxypeptidase-like regulatory domain-containing protein [Actinomycetota bacterium]